MKLALAIICSLMLIGISFLSRHVPGSCAMPKSHACCHVGAKMNCCQAAPDSTPFPAFPVHGTVQSIHLHAFVPAITFGSLPERSLPPAGAVSSPLSATSLALY